MTSTRRFVFPALIAAGILWGTTVPLSKVALGWLPPAWLAEVRFVLAAAVLMIAARSKLRAAFSPAIVLSGGLGYGGSVLLQNIGIDRTSVTHAALLIGATPVIVAVLAAALGHSVAKPLAWAGFGLSLAGVAFIAGGQGAGSTLTGDGLVLASQLASAGFTVSQARLLRGRDPVAVTGLQLMAAAVLVGPVALLTEHRAAGPVSASALLATIALVVAGTVGPTTLFAFGQSRVSADVAGAFLNIEPLVGAILGVMLFANPVGAAQIAGGTAIVAGIGLSSFQVVRAVRLRKTTVVAGTREAMAEPDLALIGAAGLDDRMSAAASGPVRSAGLKSVSVVGPVTAFGPVSGPADSSAPGPRRTVADGRRRAGSRGLDLPHPKIDISARRARRLRRVARRLAASTRPARGGRWRPGMVTGRSADADHDSYRRERGAQHGRQRRTDQARRAGWRTGRDMRDTNRARDGRTTRENRAAPENYRRHVRREGRERSAPAARTDGRRH